MCNRFMPWLICIIHIDSCLTTRPYMRVRLGVSSVRPTNFSSGADRATSWPACPRTLHSQGPDRKHLDGCRNVLGQSEGHLKFGTREHQIAHPHRAREPTPLEETVTTLFCFVDGAYLRRPRPGGTALRLAQATLRLGGPSPRPSLQQLRGVEGERSFLRDADRFFARLFPRVAGLAIRPPSSAV